MKSGLLVLFVATALSAGCAKLVVVHVDNGVTADGVFYALPKTVVRVAVKVDHTTAKAAPFMKFAAIFAPDGEKVCKNPKCEGEGEKEKYELQQGASFATFGEPDPDNVYMVKFVGGGAIDQTVSMTWNDTGLLSAASASVTNRTTDVVISGLKLAASLGTKAFFGAPVGKEVEPTCPDTNQKNDSWIIPILKAGREVLVINYCDIDTKDREQFEQSKDEPLLRQATKAYMNHVDSLATARESLLTGGSQSMEPAELVGRLETLIAQRLAELYLGSKKKETWEGSLDIRQLDAGKAIPVLRINPAAGICIDQAEIAPDAKPYPEKFKILEKDDCQNATAVNMAISYYPAEANQLFQKVRDNTVEPPGQRSFRYRIPAQVKAELKDAKDSKDPKKNYGAGVFSIAQLGTIASLPAKRNSKMLSYDLTFLEATGGLKSFKLGTTGALDSATVDALSGVGGTILDARNAARKAEQTAKDEVTILTRQDTLLKLKDEICQIQKKYGLACTVEP